MKSKELNKTVLAKQFFVQKVFSLRNKDDIEIREIISTICQPKKNKNDWCVDALQSFQLALDHIGRD